MGDDGVMSRALRCGTAALRKRTSDGSCYAKLFAEATPGPPPNNSSTLDYKTKLKCPDGSAVIPGRKCPDGSMPGPASIGSLDRLAKLLRDGPTRQCPDGSTVPITRRCDKPDTSSTQLCPDGNAPGPDGKCGSVDWTWTPPAKCFAPNVIHDDGKCGPQCQPNETWSGTVCFSAHAGGTEYGTLCADGSPPPPGGKCPPRVSITPCASGSPRLPNGLCPANCPLGTKKSPDGTCAIADACPSGEIRADNGQCVRNTPPATCPDGSPMPAAGLCAVAILAKPAPTCPDGRPMPANGSCGVVFLAKQAPMPCPPPDYSACDKTKHPEMYHSELMWDCRKRAEAAAKDQCQAPPPPPTTSLSPPVVSPPAGGSTTTSSRNCMTLSGQAFRDCLVSGGSIAGAGGVSVTTVNRLPPSPCTGLSGAALTACLRPAALATTTPGVVTSGGSTTAPAASCSGLRGQALDLCLRRERDSGMVQLPGKGKDQPPSNTTSNASTLSHPTYGNTPPTTDRSKTTDLPSSSTMTVRTNPNPVVLRSGGGGNNLYHPNTGGDLRSGPTTFRQPPPPIQHTMPMSMPRTAVMMPRGGGGARPNFFRR